MSNTNSPYYKPIAPKNSLELIWWFIFEPERAEYYEETLSRKDQLLKFLVGYIVLCIGIFLVYLLGNIIIALFDLPSITPSLFKESFTEEWDKKFAFLEKFVFLLNYHLFGLAVGLAVGLTIGVVIVSVGGLAIGLAGGLTVGLGGILVLGVVGKLAGVLAFGVAFGVAFEVAVILSVVIAEEITEGVVFGVTIGLAFGVGFGVIVGLVVGIAFLLNFCLVFFRIIFFPFYQIIYLNDSLASNIILRDARIWVLPWGYKNKLVGLAKATPEEGIDFVNFLLEKRPLQRKLAIELQYAALGSLAYNDPLNDSSIKIPLIPDDNSKLIPTQKWFELLHQIKKELKNSQQESNARLRLNSFTRFFEALKKFRNQNRVESPQWNHYYFKALEKWTQESLEKIKVLEEEAKDIVFNPYKVGDPLQPDQNQLVFMGRQDLKDELTFAIRSSETMPLFLIQGQRRVGKTSLLNFLQTILGERYIIINMDLQNVNDCKDVLGWMESLRIKFNQALKLKEEYWSAPDNWLESWKQLSNHMIQHSKNTNYKVIIAMDEYESLQEKGFSKAPQQAKHLLGAIRSFSQHQKQVVLLFIGVALFSELENPKWSDYFVNAKRLKVDYLSKENTSQLINKPFQDFPINYQKGNTEIIYEQTQGHPALVQYIGRELVELSNKVNRLDITKEDLKQVIEEKLLDENNGTFAVFWGQFCSEECMKDAVRSVILGKEVADRECLKKLLRHDFIVKSNDTYKMRVPLFERWVRKFDIDI